MIWLTAPRGNTNFKAVNIKSEKNSEKTQTD